MTQKERRMRKSIVQVNEVNAADCTLKELELWWESQHRYAEKCVGSYFPPGFGPKDNWRKSLADLKASEDLKANSTKG